MPVQDGRRKLGCDGATSFGERQSGMKTESRRQFLQKASQTGMTIAVGAVARRFGIAQNTTTTKVVIDTDRQIAPVSHELFGSFLEQLGRAIYEGVYEPGSKFADSERIPDRRDARKCASWVSRLFAGRAGISCRAITGWTA